MAFCRELAIGTIHLEMQCITHLDDLHLVIEQSSKNLQIQHARTGSATARPKIASVSIRKH